MWQHSGIKYDDRALDYIYIYIECYPNNLMLNSTLSSVAHFSFSFNWLTPNHSTDDKIRWRLRFQVLSYTSNFSPFITHRYTVRKVKSFFWKLLTLMGHQVLNKSTCCPTSCMPADFPRDDCNNELICKTKILVKSNSSLAVSQEKGKRCWLELLRSKNITGDKQLVTGTTVWAQDSKELRNRLIDMCKAR